MKVSVVSASYNHAKILPRMYEQVMAQRDLIHEWIICDDGSLDGTFSLIKKYSRDPMLSCILNLYFLFILITSIGLYNHRVY